MRRFGWCLTALAVVLMIGCATVQRIDVKNLIVPIPAAGPGRVAVAVVDARDVVVDGEKTPNYAGRVRRASLNWVEVTTDRPLAAGLAEAIERSLVRVGFTVETVSVDPGTSLEQAVEQALATGADRAVVLVIDRFTFEHYATTRLVHDLSLTIAGPDGKPLADTSSAGDARIGRAMDHGAVKQNVETALRLKLNKLLNSPHTARALTWD